MAIFSGNLTVLASSVLDFRFSLANVEHQFLGMLAHPQLQSCESLNLSTQLGGYVCWNILCSYKVWWVLGWLILAQQSWFYCMAQFVNLALEWFDAKNARGAQQRKESIICSSRVLIHRGIIKSCHSRKSEMTRIAFGSLHIEMCRTPAPRSFHSSWDKLKFPAGSCYFGHFRAERSLKKREAPSL